jgi:hypothetical protein
LGSAGIEAGSGGGGLLHARGASGGRLATRRGGAGAARLGERPGGGHLRRVQPNRPEFGPRSVAASDSIPVRGEGCSVHWASPATSVRDAAEVEEARDGAGLDGQLLRRLNRTKGTAMLGSAELQ